VRLRARTIEQRRADGARAASPSPTPCRKGAWFGPVPEPGTGQAPGPVWSGQLPARGWQGRARAAHWDDLEAVAPEPPHPHSSAGPCLGPHHRRRHFDSPLL